MGQTPHGIDSIPAAPVSLLSQQCGPHCGTISVAEGNSAAGTHTRHCSCETCHNDPTGGPTQILQARAKKEKSD